MLQGLDHNPPQLRYEVSHRMVGFCYTPGATAIGMLIAMQLDLPSEKAQVR